MPPLDEAAIPKELTVEDMVWRIGEEMRRLAPGDLARLRRAADDPLRAPHYWRWKARFGWQGKDDNAWAAIIAIMAILTPKGRGEDKRSPHNPKNSLGRALCDGGDPAWPGKMKKPRPKVSELRLAKLLNTTGPTRQDALLRVVRAIARNDIGINCAEIANFLIHDHAEWPTRNIARNYYKHLDRAEHHAATTEEKESS